MGARGKIASNGLEHALVRRGRRVYNVEHEFFEWHQVQGDPRLLAEWIKVQKEGREQLVAWLSSSSQQAQAGHNRRDGGTLRAFARRWIIVSVGSRSPRSIPPM